MSELALKLIHETIETRATQLDMRGHGLTKLPEELSELVWLEELYLDDNEELIRLDALIDLVSLKELTIFNTKVSDLSPIANLTNLNKLYLDNTQVTDLSHLSNLTNLKSFGISDTRVKDLTPLSNLINLNELFISLTRVENLDFLANFLYLKKLFFHGTPISDLSPLANLVSLKELEFTETPVSDLSPLANLSNLNWLNIANTQVVDLTPLENLSNLSYLNISNTQVNNLSPLEGIIKKGILVSWDRKQKGILVYQCPLSNPPIEIAKLGNESILSYWKQLDTIVLPAKWQELLVNVEKNNKIISDLKQKLGEIDTLKIHSELLKSFEKIAKIRYQLGTIELFEAKLIIVGEGGTGKTTLFEKLKDPNHKVGNTPETHGINIYEGLPFKNPLIGENTFHVNLWDFGGQELQYMTHQFFLTPRALYVLMMDARRESPNLAYWFKIISLLGRDSETSTEKVNLLLVFNKRGNTTGQPPQYQDQLKYYADSLSVHYLEVDFAENDFRYQNLLNTIQQSLVTLPIVKSKLPRLWKVLREELREEAQTKNYISTLHFSAICSKHEITEEGDQWLLSGYLHQLGSLLHFQNDLGLRGYLILKPQWAVDGVYSFLSEQSISDNGGHFNEGQFIQLLGSKGYSRNEADLILQLMTKNNFDICYEATSGKYVAAQLLPDNAPEYRWYPKEVLQFRYQYPIMPKGLMSRLIVRLSEFIERNPNTDEQIVWKKGVVLYFNLIEGECRVRLREDDAESKSGLRQILIEVIGAREARKYALHRVRDVIEDLHKKWFRSIKPDEMVPCCCTICAVSDEPELYKLEKLLKARKNRPDKSCDESGENVMIQDLLEGVYNTQEIRDMTNEQDLPQNR